MRTSAIIRIIFFSLALFLLLGVLGVSLMADTLSARFDRDVTMAQSPNPSDQPEVTGTTPATAQTPTATTDTFTGDPVQIRQLEIEWAAGSITIAPEEGLSEILVTETQPSDAKYAMVCKQNGDTLSIRFCKDSIKFPTIGVSASVKDLVISVPADWICHSLEIEAASADVVIHDMTIWELDFDGASGTCELLRCDVGSLDVGAASGEITFSGCLNRLDFDGASGDCTLALTNCPNRIDLEGLSGSLNITLPSDCGFTVACEGLCSNFSTDFATTLRNGLHHYGNGACRIEIEALSGKVMIHDGGYTCHGPNEDCPNSDNCSTHSGHHYGHH